MAGKYAPKHDDERKEAKDVNECHDAFDKRQFPEKHGVDEDTQKQDGPREHGNFPGTRDVACISQVDQGSNLLCRCLAGRVQLK